MPPGKETVKTEKSLRKETVKTNKAPAPLGAYSQGSKAHNFLFVGGQLGIVPGVTPYSLNCRKEP